MTSWAPFSFQIGRIGGVAASIVRIGDIESLMTTYNISNIDYESVYGSISFNTSANSWMITQTPTQNSQLILQPMNKSENITHLMTTTSSGPYTFMPVVDNSTRYNPYIYLWRLTSSPVSNTWDSTTLFAKAMIVNMPGATNSTGYYSLRWDVVATTITPPSPNPNSRTSEFTVPVSISFALACLAILLSIVLTIYTCSRRHGYNSLN